MKFRKLLLAIVSVSALGLLTACGTDSVDKNVHNKTTFLGIYTSEPEAYTAVTPATARLRSDEVTGMELPSGQRTSWLWGLITYTDY